MNHRVLIVAYQFPPVGGAGVQRVTKLTRYLPAHGWDCSVLTTDHASVPVTDDSLHLDVPEDTLIRRAASWEPGYRIKQAIGGSTNTAESPQPPRLWKRLAKNLSLNLLQPDPQILWVPAAIRAGRELLRSETHDAILVSGPPFSSFLVGRKLSREFGLPLVLDFRDEWGISSRFWENRVDNVWTRTIQQRMQRSLFRNADALVATTELSAASLHNESRRIGYEVPVECIHNGYDPRDFPAKATRIAEQRSTDYDLTHVGTLWKLTSVAPTLSGIEHLADSKPDLTSRLRLRLVGRATDDEERRISHIERAVGIIDRQDYVDHSEAVRTMCLSSELGLFLSDVDGAERVMPGKTFEYLASGRPILAIAREGEMTNLLRRFEGVSIFSPGDTRGIAQHFRRRIETSAPLQSIDRRSSLARFERAFQAGQMAELLSRSAADRRISSAA